MWEQHEFEQKVTSPHLKQHTRSFRFDLATIETEDDG